MQFVWVFNGERSEGESWLTTFLAQAPGEPAIRGRALVALGTIKRDQGDFASAQLLFEQSLRCNQDVVYLAQPRPSSFDTP